VKNDKFELLFSNCVVFRQRSAAGKHCHWEARNGTQASFLLPLIGWI